MIVLLEVARGDYAANSGDGEQGMRSWVKEMDDYDQKTEWVFLDYSNIAAHEWPPFDGQTGINYNGAEIKAQSHHRRDVENLYGRREISARRQVRSRCKRL